MGGWVLGIDIGSGGPKVAVVADDGAVLAWSGRAVPTRTGADGSSTQDAGTWWSAIRDAACEAIAAAGADGRALRAVGITGQWGSTVPVADDGTPAGEVLMWSDHRAEPFVADVVGGPLSVSGYAPHRVLPWIRLSGGGPSLSGADPTGHSLLLQRTLRDVYSRTRWLMEPVDYVGLLLTGRPAATPASMTLSWLTDNRPGKQGAAPSYEPDLVRRSQRDSDRLPELIPTGSVLGTLLPGVAAELGVSADAPVIAGVPDLHAAVVGSGSVAPFESHVTISTTAWLGARVPFKKTDVLHSIATIPGLDPAYPIVANNHETAGAALEWLAGALLGGMSYAEISDAAQRVPAGADGVLFTPWLAGERSPVEDKRLRASFVGMSLRTDRAVLARAVMEGVAHNARWLMEAYESFLGRPVPSLRILGGGAISDVWCEIHAGVLGVPVERVADPRAAQLRGIALWARICLGELALADVPALVPVDRVFEPAHREAYDRSYAEFRRLYKALRGVHHRMAAE